MDEPKPFLSGASDEPPFRERRTGRVPLDQATSLRSDRLCAIEVRVRNLSTVGFMAECPASIQIGSYLTLEVPGIGPVEGQVRWQLGPKLGGRFIDPISLARCEWTGEEVPAETD